MKYFFLGLIKQIIMGTWQQLVADVDGPFLYFKEWGSVKSGYPKSFNGQHFYYYIAIELRVSQELTADTLTRINNPNALRTQTIHQGITLGTVVKKCGLQYRNNYVMKSQLYWLLAM